MAAGFRIVETGLVKVMGGIKNIAGSGMAVKGPIATWGSRLPYAAPVNFVWRRGSGGAHMFERGIADTQPMIVPTLMEAIPKGAASVGQAKRKIRDTGVENIKKYTPVRTGRLQNSIQEMSRPIGIPDPPL